MNGSSPRPTAPTWPRRPGAAVRTSRRMSCSPSRSSPRCAESTRTTSARASRPTQPPRSRSREAPGRSKPRARTALPRGREHPRRDRPPRRARPERRRAGGRSGPGRPHGVPRRPGSARACRRARPWASAASRRASPRPREHRARVRRRAPPRSRRPRSSADEVRREPAVQRRHTADRGEPRPPPERRSLDGDGPARGRRSSLRAARDEGVRRGLGARAARGRAHRLPSRRPHGLSAAAGRRLGARRLSSRGAARKLRRDKGRGSGGVRAPAQDAAELARAGGPRLPPEGRRGSGSDRARAERPGRSSRAGGVRRARAGPPMKAHAKINLALVVGPRRADGMHEVATVLQRIDLADDIALGAANKTEVEGYSEDTLVHEALRAIAVTAKVRIEKRIPVAAGLGGGSSDAATTLRLANETLEGPLGRQELHRLARELGADVPFFLGEGPQLGLGSGATLSELVLPQDYSVVLVLPRDAKKRSTKAVCDAFAGEDGF